MWGKIASVPRFVQGGAGEVSARLVTSVTRVTTVDVMMHYQKFKPKEAT